MEKSLGLTTAEGGYTLIFASFMQESIGHMIPWLIAALFVILCDLVVGLRKSLIIGDEVRFSSACRRTIGKIISYFMFVITMAVVDVAADGNGDIEKWACLLICFIEFSSIVSNILKTRGYKINLAKLVAIVFGKKFDINPDDLGGVIEEEKNGRGK